MSTIPEKTREEDRVVANVSRWLARHISDDELHDELEQVDVGCLGPEGADGIAELLNELGHGGERAPLEMVARETVEAVALGL